MSTQTSSSINASRILGTVGVPAKQMWYGVYLGSCVQTNDPLGQGRILMYVPQVLGTAISNWAYPLGFGILSTQVDEVGTMGPYVNIMPTPGTLVHAMFVGGDVNHPIYAYVNTMTLEEA